MTISLEGHARVDVYSFDYAGRLWTSLEGGKSFRHGLDGRVFAKWKEGDGRQEREWLNSREAEAIETRARKLLEEVVAAISAGSLDLEPVLSDRELTRLTKASMFTEEKQAQDRHEFQRIYRPIGILPPEQYMAVVLQLTEGCSFNSCTFCGLYRGQEFRVKTPEEFLRHAMDVRDFLKEGISLRRTIFLGCANALILPVEKLRVFLKIVAQVFDINSLGGIYAFVDGFSGEKKTPGNYLELAELGLNTICIGLESGCNDLLRFLNKPSTSGQVLETVKAAKSAGISAAVIVLLGAGGRAFNDRHIIETVQVLNEMKLDGGDMIYFSKIVPAVDAPYFSTHQNHDLSPLTEAEQEEQWQAIESQLIFEPHLGIPTISVYDIRDFVF